MLKSPCRLEALMGINSRLEESMPWLCICGFSNRSTNSVCGGTGPLGCKGPRSSLAAIAPDDIVGEIDLPPQQPGTLRLASYNVHFGKNWQQARMQAIAQLLTRADVDVVALQEVTDALLSMMLDHLEADQWQMLPQFSSHAEDLFLFESNYYTVLLIKKHMQVVAHGCVPWRSSRNGVD